MPRRTYAAMLCCLSAALLLLLPVPSHAATHAPMRVLTVPVTGPITPATEELLHAALEHARQDQAALLVIELDTPGGLMDSMRTMVKAMLGAPLPVAVWVGPSGARATSAGVFLVAASALAGMSPQSTIGAASPVAMGGQDVPETMSRKLMNDTVSYVRTLAQEHNRNTDWYERAVRHAESLSAPDAVINRVAEVLASDMDDFLLQAGRRGIPLDDGSALRFSPGEIVVQRHDPGLRHAFLSWLLHPQVAYLLFIGGLAGLFFELSTPGVILPGVLGGLSLLLGLYAMSVLPTNVAGVLLILFSIVLFVLELKITSFGMLTIAALAALGVGSTLLFHNTNPLFGLPTLTIAVTVGGIGLLFVGGGLLVGRAQLQKPTMGQETMLGMHALVESWEGAVGTVRVRGELWNATSDFAFQKGDTAIITAIDGLLLYIKRVTEPS